MEMIRHQNIFADEYTTRQAGLAKLSEVFVDFDIGENGFAVFGVGGDEVERMAGEKPVKTLEPGRTLIRVHGEIVAAVCDRRKKFEWRTAVTDRRYSERCRPAGAGELDGAGGYKDGAANRDNALTIAQPFMAGSSAHLMKSPVRDGRTVLSSHPGLGKNADHESQP